MNLSKIYRGTETAGLKAFHFLAFGESGAGTPVDHSLALETAVTPVPKAAPKTSPAAQQELDEAYARGQRDALKNGGHQLETSAQALAGALIEISRLRATLAAHSRDDMLRLVMVIAEQVIHQQVTIDPAIVVKVIEQALQASVRADHYKIRINPADLKCVTEQKPLFLASISGLKNLTIESDPAITPGGCRVESDLGEVDATLETQLDTIGQTLRDALTGMP